jgi:hypothetical protein
MLFLPKSGNILLTQPVGTGQKGARAAILLNFYLGMYNMLLGNRHANFMFCSVLDVDFRFLGGSLP